MGEFKQNAAEQTGRSEAAELGSQLSLWPAGGGENGAPADSAGAPLEVVVPPKPADPAWTLTDLGAFVVWVFLTLVAIVFLRQAFGGQSLEPEAYTQAPLLVAMQVGLEALWLGFIYFTITVKYQRPFWDALRWKLGAHRPRNWLAAGALMALAAQLYFLASPSGNELPIEKLFSSPGSGYVLAVFGIFVAPFFEELVFRGFVYPVFERMWGFAAAVLLTALLFAVIHVPQLWGGWEEIATIFVVGAAFSYSRGKTGSLVPSYLMHLGYNMALFVLLYLSTDGFRTLKG